MTILSKRCFIWASRKIVEHWTARCRNWDMVLNQLELQSCQGDGVVFLATWFYFVPRKAISIRDGVMIKVVNDGKDIITAFPVK